MTALSHKIVVLDGGTMNPGDNPWDALAALGRLDVFDRSTPDEILSRAKSADVIVTNKAALPAAVIDALPALKFITVTATGYNVVDVAAAKRRGIAVANVPEYGTSNVAQFTFGLILELCHGIGRHGQSVREGGWQQSGVWSYWLSPQAELSGKKLGIVGFGRIGQRVAELGRAFGMEICAVKPRTAPTIVYPVQWMTTDDLFAECDVITLHCPQTATNARMVNDALLSRMKRTAFFINTARGGLVDEQALADHLRRDTLAGAAVDVASAEPIANDNPLLSAPNCLITPHIAWATLEARKRLMTETAKNIAAFIAGQPIVNQVNQN